MAQKVNFGTEDDVLGKSNDRRIGRPQIHSELDWADSLTPIPVVTIRCGTVDGQSTSTGGVGRITQHNQLIYLPYGHHTRQHLVGKRQRARAVRAQA